MESNKFQGKVRMTAHSMGNVVAGEALRLPGRRIHSYAASQAAFAGSCYDPNAPAMAFRTYGQAPAGFVFGPPNASTGPDTPDVYSFYGPPAKNFDPSTWDNNNYPSYLSAGNIKGGATNYFNYHNAQDYALTWPRWQLDQQLKPQYNLGTYGFDIPNDHFKRGNAWMEFPNDTHEIYAWAAEPRCIALGAGVVNGVIGTNFNLQSISYAGARKWHSGQFRGMNMQRKNYWRRLLDDFGLLQQAP